MQLSEDAAGQAEQRLTALGLLCFVALIALGVRYDLLWRLILFHPAVAVCTVAAVLAMVPLALYGVGNAWRLYLRPRRNLPGGECDLGWGGALTHYTAADDDALCGLMGTPEGGDGDGDLGGD